MQTGAVLLHDHTGDNVLVRLLQLGQHAQARLHHRAGPVVYLVVLVRVTADGGLDRFLDDFAHVVHDELMLFPAVIHCVGEVARGNLLNSGWHTEAQKGRFFLQRERGTTPPKDTEFSAPKIFGCN